MWRDGRNVRFASRNSRDVKTERKFNDPYGKFAKNGQYDDFWNDDSAEHGDLYDQLKSELKHEVLNNVLGWLNRYLEDDREDKKSVICPCHSKEQLAKNNDDRMNATSRLNKYAPELSLIHI